MVSLTLAASSSALTLDTSFGQNGASPGFTLPAGNKWRVVDTVVRADGSIAILVSNLRHKRFGIYSVTAEGLPDPAFGPRGWRTGSLSIKRKGAPFALAAYPDGRLAVAARRFDGRKDSAVVVRFDRDGKQDFDFARGRGDNTSVARKLPVPGRHVYPGDLVVDSNNNVIASYSVDLKRLGAVRLDPNGRPDPLYGHLNQRQFNSIDFSRYYGVWPDSIALLPDNGVVIGGWVETDYCDDPEMCPAGGWSQEDPVVIRLTRNGFLLRSFGGPKAQPRGASWLSTGFDSYRLGLSARPDGTVLTALDSTFSFPKPGTKNEGDQAYSTIFRRLLPNGLLDLAFSSEDGLHDPAYPTATGWDNDLFRRGFSVSPAGAIAVCGQARRTIPKDKGPFEYDHPGFIQVIDATSAADEAVSAANLLWTADTENAIEDCAWQSEGKLLTVDLNKTLTVSRYHP